MKLSSLSPFKLLSYFSPKTQDVSKAAPSKQTATLLIDSMSHKARVRTSKAAAQLFAANEKSSTVHISEYSSIADQKAKTAPRLIDSMSHKARVRTSIAAAKAKAAQEKSGAVYTPEFSSIADQNWKTGNVAQKASILLGLAGQAVSGAVGSLLGAITGTSKKVLSALSSAGNASFSYLSRKKSIVTPQADAQANSAAAAE